MKKKLTICILAAAMAMSLAACGDDKKEEATTAAKETTTAEATTEEATISGDDGDVYTIEDQSDDVGIYELYEYESGNTKVDHATLENTGMKGSLALKNDGTAELNLFDSPIENLTWESGKLIMAGSVNYDYTISGDTLTLDMTGVVYHFRRTGALGTAAEDDEKKTTAATTASSSGNTAETEYVAKHGVYTIKYDESIYRLPTDDDWVGDLIPLDDTKFPKLYVTSLDGEDRLKEELDAIDEVRSKDSSAVEELTIDGHEAIIYKSNEDFLGYFYCLVIPFDQEIKSSDGYYSQINAVYIYGYGETEDMIYNDTIKNIMLSVDIDESVEKAAADAAADAATEEQAKVDAGSAAYGYGKSNAEATGNCSLEVLKETYAWQKDAGSGLTYEEFKEHFGCDGAPWFDVAFDNERHAYKWQTEDGADFLYVTFKVNDDGSETYSSCTYSTAVKGE